MDTMTRKRAASPFLPYGRQNVTESDIEAVTQVLRSDWLTQGPAVPAFEKKLAETVGSAFGVACANGTAALHLAMLALGIREGDVVVTSTNTFLASANCARYAGAGVKFADIDPNTGLIDIQSLKRILSADRERRIKAVIPVHFAGQPVDLASVHAMASKHGAYVVDDACHAIGSDYESGNRRHLIGGNPHSDLTVFSFHPVKHVAMGEGGAVTTSNEELASRLKLFRNHGMQKGDFVQEEMALSGDGEVNPWYYEMQNPGYNYRLTEMQAALGLGQIKRLSESVERRNQLAEKYRLIIADTFAPEEVRPLDQSTSVTNAYHLFVVRVDFERLAVSRAQVMTKLREFGIGTQVHYIPVHTQPYYRKVSPTRAGELPGADEYYSQALSLPMYPELTAPDCERVVRSLRDVLGR